MVKAKRQRADKATLTAWQNENPLRVWRLSQQPEGWNQSVLARKLGVSHTAVGLWESGKRLPMIDAVAKIENLTGVTAKQWMAWVKRKPT